MPETKQDYMKSKKRTLVGIIETLQETIEEKSKEIKRNEETITALREEFKEVLEENIALKAGLNKKAEPTPSKQDFFLAPVVYENLPTQCSARKITERLMEKMWQKEVNTREKQAERYVKGLQPIREITPEVLRKSGVKFRAGANS